MWQRAPNQKLPRELDFVDLPGVVQVLDGKTFGVFFRLLAHLLVRQPGREPHCVVLLGLLYLYLTCRLGRLCQPPHRSAVNDGCRRLALFL